MFKTLFFSFENHAVYEIMRKKFRTAGHAADCNIIWSMQFACRITESRTRSTHSECVILSAFPLQQMFRERAPLYLIRTLPVLLRITISAWMDIVRSLHVTFLISQTTPARFSHPRTELMSHSSATHLPTCGSVTFKPACGQSAAYALFIAVSPTSL
jgi:hypothetical protein